MPRRRVAQRREVLPDPVYNNPLVTKFINGVMLGGKKSTAERIFYSALTQVGEKAGDEPLKLYSVYGPPDHPDGTVHPTRADAESDELDR